MSTRLGSFGRTALIQTPLNVISILVLFAILLSFYKIITEKHSLFRITILGSCLLILFTTVLLTQSRATYVAILFAGIPLLLDKKKYIMILIGIILLVSALSPVKDKFLNHITNDKRIPIIYITKEVIKEYPIVGIGFGMQTYGELDLNKYRKRIPQKYQAGHIVTDPHNLLMDITVRLGVVGLVLFSYIIFVFFKICWDIIKYGKNDFIKNWGRCLAAAFIVVFVIGLFQPIFSHMPEVVICTIFSMTTIVWHLNGQIDPKFD